MKENYDLNEKETEKTFYKQTLEKLLKEEKIYTQQLMNEEEQVR